MNRKYKYASIASLLSAAVLLGTGCSMTEQKQPDTTNTKNVSNVNKDQKTDSSKSDLTDQEFVLESKYFNQLKEINGLPTIQNPENILALVNKEYALPGDYKPADLTVPNVQFSFKEDIEKRYIRKEAAEALEDLFKAAKKQGYELAAVSGYRSYDRQKTIYDNEVSLKGEKKAKEAVAYPGESEHQTGLAMDISSKSMGYALSQDFINTKDGKWVDENAYKYGYIIRYPKGKESITKYEYEPWHLRYVGKKAAKVIKEHNLTLEEYFKKVKKI
ncbi:peptidase M15 [Bacillus glycinifermentans]|uniref:M15 family metallopeptidase n=1 Tax=Bacillus glycinifermentans TaxID=1664069 RepID=A0A0J6EPR3_9BACI|nr:M15 family metallopeptidase [Bacillus glycinifermentans]ATH92054.1 peptidase M15 [Bacillus glycinifermentans]KMM62486.1 peptidase M15 [Bacillus glycinifermentans]KRT93017.1 peptidase M15 [Bacillus glycinifermentans]MEC0486651.1 M15 family metallopeptidase [Bacillus glycinifermentans]MEC0494786.1 M15 family metallopeptidase [Bacillus glycinifermentans]